MTARISAFALAAAAALPAQASIVIATSSSTYSQSFDSLATTGSSNPWLNDSTLAGWSLFRQPLPGTALTTYAADNGSSNAGTFKSFGSSGSTDRALGGVGSGGAYFGSPLSNAVAGWIALSVTNGTGAALTGFNLGFDGEQWRDGGAATPGAQAMVLEYGFGTSFTTVAGWAAAGISFNWSSPVFTNTGSGVAVNGNASGLVSNVGGSISTPWATGDTLWLRWVEKNDSGNDHGLAIDNLRFSVISAVPEPGTTVMLLAGLAALGFVARRRA
jgi:hypothetical protein